MEVQSENYIEFGVRLSGSISHKPYDPEQDIETLGFCCLI